MTTYEADGITLKKVRDCVWEIPQEGGMNRPARVLASEDLLDEISDDKTLQQLKNATHLPGVRKYAVCMPDGHQGYGFPVGGVAGIDAENGCISPGAVGYDINCLPGGAEVQLSFGRRMELQNMERRFEEERAMVADGDNLVPSDIRLFTKSDEKPVYEVETATGYRIEATGDHPFRTSDGMTELDDLSVGDDVRVHPFEGIDHEDPSECTILTEDDFEDENPQLVRVLEDRGVLPLSSTDDEFNHLLKILGFFLGDGSYGGPGQVWFSAEPEDLEQVRSDVKRIGFKPSKIYGRDRNHGINGSEFERTEYSFKTTSKAFRRLLVALGAPEGPKVDSGYSSPEYLDRLTDWQRALFYSAYFGAEMNEPSAQYDKNLYCPKVSQTRTAETVEDGFQFYDDLREFLTGLGIETNEVERFETDSNSEQETVRLRLGVTNDSENLLRFFSRIGYRYDREKQRRSVKAIQYLRTKEREIERREAIESEAQTLADGGSSAESIKAEFDINDRFMERSVWGGRDSRPRPDEDFPGFEEFCEAVEVADDHTILDEVVAIRRAGRKEVYDIGVSHEAHNFVANGFVVSNCGVRMLKTPLTYDDVEGREEELVDALFANIPSGLGGGGVYEGTKADVDAILERGMEWALENDFALPADLEHCEDEGVRHDADPSRVSQKAKDRGKNQTGSLGSGNHFLEVQHVTDVYREDVAEQFGLTPDQIVVLIHCGSRGLGHQVCTDYLRDIEQAHAGLLDRLPDRELAAAPAGSQLAEDYYGAMCAAINFAWVNRQLIMHRTREVFGKVFDVSVAEMDLLYDVAHNIAKKEAHEVEGSEASETSRAAGEAGDGEERELFVHRKGATRAFPAGRPEVPPAYQDVGQPILIPGSMGAGSYVLRGGERSLSETFGSTAHGAGRLMSRTQAKQEFWGGDVRDDLREQDHVYVKAQSGATVAEEAPGVYKDVDEVVRVSDALGIGDRVARTFPVCTIKG